MKFHNTIAQFFLDTLRNFRWGMHEGFLGVLLLLILLAGFTLLRNPLQQGLRVAYYDNTEWRGSPFFTTIEPSISLDKTQRLFPRLKRYYSIYWEGMIEIPESGEYHFALVSDDGSDFYIDDRQIINNRGLHPVREKAANLWLQQGFHRLKVRYMQGGGSALFRVYWTPPGQQRALLPPRCLFLEEPAPKALLVGRLLETIQRLCVLLTGGVLILWGGWGISTRRFSLRDVSPRLMIPMILLIVFITHFMSSVSTPIDSMWSIPTALSVIREGNLDLNEYEHLANRHANYAIEQVGSHIYTLFPIGTSLLSVPVVFILDHFLQRTLKIDLELYLNEHSLIPGGIETFVASLIAAISAIVVFQIACLFFEKWIFPLLLTGIFAFCTPVWSTASRALWQHGPALLLLTLALYLWLRMERDPQHTAWKIRGLAIVLAFSFLIRPTNSFSILLFTIGIFLRYRKYLLSFCLWSLLVALPFVLYNLHIYHTFLPSYYVRGDQLALTRFLLEGLAGTLFSPSRGLFIFSPVLLFALYGIYLRLKNRQRSFLDCGLVVALILHWLISSAHPHWWGGHSYGPRYFTEMITYFLYFLIPAMLHLAKQTGKKRILLFILLGSTIVVSGFIHYRGANSQEVYEWNGGPPADIDNLPQRVWDWSDIQFLRGL